jgi:transposase
LFVGMDVRKESIDVATGVEAGGEVRHYGAIGGDRAAVARLAKKMESTGQRLVFVYEAGPCGFGIYRLLRGRGHECWVVSPGLTPRSNADRVKTDRRDALKLARLARAGELTPIHVPDETDEAMRNLVRAREDAVIMQRLGALLLRNDVRYNRKTVWTPAHRRWIAELKLPHDAQHIAFEEYVQAIDEAGGRIARLDAAIRAELLHWRWTPVVEALQAFRGIRTIHAVRRVAELGDLTRFASARHLMGYLGLVPSENSTGARRRQEAITKTGNSSARRALQRVGCSSGLCRSLKMIFPSREDQHGRMALEGSREHLCALHTQPNTVVLNRRKSSLGNARAPCELILAKALQLANDSHGFAGRDSDAFLRGTKLLHLRPPIVVCGDRDHLEKLLAGHRAVKNSVLQPES